MKKLIFTLLQIIKLVCFFFFIFIFNLNEYLIEIENDPLLETSNNIISNEQARK